MSIAEEVTCEGEDCPDATTTDGSGDTGTSTEVTKTTYCPFKHTLCVGSDGQVTVTQNETQYDDGEYNTLVLVSGCVASLTNVTPRGYVAAACCPDTDVPTTPSGDVDLAVSNKQLTTISGGQLLTQVHFGQQSNGYGVTGCGTVADPFVVTGPTIPSFALTTTPCVVNDCVTVTGEGTATQPLKICHKDGTLPAGTYGAFTVDSCGHLTAYDSDQGSSGKEYTSSTFTIDQTACTIERLATTTAQTIDFLGGSVEINEFGDIIAITAPADTLTTTINYMKADGTAGTLTYTDGLLTGQT